MVLIIKNILVSMALTDKMQTFSAETVHIFSDLICSNLDNYSDFGEERKDEIAKKRDRKKIRKSGR
jgi:hypothetical protein